MTDRDTQQSNINKTVGRLCLMVLGMVGFVIALVPLYDLFCEITGLNGKTGGPYTFDEAKAAPDTSRLIRVNFLTNTNEGMVWKFWPEKGAVRVNPGAANTVSFFVKNTTDKVMVGQAIPSVVPGSAAEFFHKTECFCFEQQVLQPGEEMEMPMRFIVGHELPKNISSINLSYALFDVTDSVTVAQVNPASIAPAAGG
jgi:cytochrome c oxidase assembly protein subunit 11|tara:strand:- start:276 stop:869 length:594 start_codon:yes stop_codon:yes gene_type:complete